MLKYALESQKLAIFYFGGRESIGCTEKRGDETAFRPSSDARIPANILATFKVKHAYIHAQAFRGRRSCTLPVLHASPFHFEVLRGAETRPDSPAYHPLLPCALLASWTRANNGGGVVPVLCQVATPGRCPILLIRIGREVPQCRVLPPFLLTITGRCQLPLDLGNRSCNAQVVGSNPIAGSSPSRS